MLAIQLLVTDIIMFVLASIFLWLFAYLWQACDTLKFKYKEKYKEEYKKRQGPFLEINAYFVFGIVMDFMEILFAKEYKKSKKHV